MAESTGKYTIENQKLKVAEVYGELVANRIKEVETLQEKSIEIAETNLN
jgi:hypothetical protein